MPPCRTCQRTLASYQSPPKLGTSPAKYVLNAITLCNKLIVPTVLHRCECWTLSRAVCDKLNVFQSRCLRTILGVKWQDHVSNEKVRLRCLVAMSLAQLVRLRRLGWAGHVLCHNEFIVHEVAFSQVDLKRHTELTFVIALQFVRQTLDSTIMMLSSGFNFL